MWWKVWYVENRVLWSTVYRVLADLVVFVVVVLVKFAIEKLAVKIKAKKLTQQGWNE